MANMTFKASLIPNSTTLGYSLGSETNLWRIYGMITRQGKSSSWNKGRDNAVAGTTVLNGYSPAFTVKTTNGSWDIGAYNHTNYTDDLVFSYVSDELYNGTNTTPTQIKFLENGHIVATLDGSATSLTTSGTTAQFYRGDQTWTSELTDSFFATKAGEVYFKATNTNTSVSVYLDSAGSTNHGIYSNGYYDGSAFHSSGKWIINRCSTGDIQIPLWASKGTSTTPVYFNSSGIPTAGSTYAGGTAVTLNGTSKAGSTASFYAPTASGTADTQALVSKGANTAPAWTNISPGITITAGTSSATPKVNVSVLGQSGTAQAITTASTSVYGCTKLTSSYTSTDSTLAATGAAIAAAIGTLDVSSVGGTGKYISAISQTDGKISATATSTSVSNAWTAGTTAGPKIATTVNGVTGTAVAIPTATASASGAVTTGDQTWAGSKTFNGTVICAKTTDAAGTADNKPALIVGGASTAAHIEIDNNEILAKSNGTTPTTLWLQDTTGIVTVAGSGGFNVTNSVSTFSKNVVIQSNGILNCYRTTTGRFMEMFSNSQSVGYWRNETLGTTSVKGWADIIIGNSLADTADKNAHGRIYLGANGGWASYTGETGALGGTNRHYVNFGYIKATQAWGAVWNDYAEFRETKEKIEPGRCICEIGDDTLRLTSKRLERGCEIVSDTYGFAIGESEKAKTPTAASGRVLAYPYEDREEFTQHIGWPVCSGPNGTVSIMTEEEEEKYPSRIIGTISAVPNYEIWHAGSEENKEDILVNGRIWIRIR